MNIHLRRKEAIYKVQKSVYLTIQFLNHYNEPDTQLDARDSKMNEVHYLPLSCLHFSEVERHLNHELAYSLNVMRGMSPHSV